MEKSFDFGALLKKHEKQHKSKPTHFQSVAGGVKKRLENNLKHRRSSRLTIFDSIRNLGKASRCDSPVPMTEAQQKVENRRQQLEKWKQEKEKRKKEEAALKKKPFITGLPHNPLKFVPPPPPPKTVPSTSGRITRSQTAKNKKELILAQSQSIAPKNAPFRAPQIKNLKKLPKLAPIETRKFAKTAAVTFQPIVPASAQTEVKQTRSRMQNKQTAVDTRVIRSAVETRARGKITKPAPKAIPKYLISSSSSENEHSSSDQTLTSIRMQTSSSSEDLTAKILSSSSDKSFTKIVSSSENESAKSLQSSSSSEFESEKKPSPVSVNQSKKSLNTISSPVTKSKTPRKSTTPRKSPCVSLNKLKLCTPTNLIPKSESGSEERLRLSKSPADLPRTPEQIIEEAVKNSPYVTLSRGKNNARIEMKKKLEEGVLDEDASDMDNVDQFRRQLASEIKRITEMCDTWDKIYEQVALPEAVQELVLGGVGQARLLMSQKLQQFAALIERCARPDPASALVTPADLHGFWDMVYMQVENVDMRFKKLEELKSRNWMEDAPAQAARAAGKPAAKLAGKPKAAGTSRLKEIIAAARKAKKQELQPPPAASDKTFEAGFFCVRSPARSPHTPHTSHTPHTPSTRHSLLKAVLSSEAQKASASKNSASSFAMLRASVLGKNVECEGVAPLPQTPLAPVNLNATPGRSILKQSADTTIKKFGSKSIKVVLFDQFDTETEDINTSPNKDVNVDSGLSSMDVENDSAKKDKENSRSKPKLARQDAIQDDVDYISPVMTRSRRKTMMTPQTEEKTEKIGQRRSGRKKKVLEEIENVAVVKQTPKRSTRSRKSAPEVL